MEYFVGAAITVGVIFFAKRYLTKHVEDVSIGPIEYSQTHVYELVKPFIQQLPPPEISDTQAANFLKQTYMRIMVVNNKAYWIKDNIFYVANVVDGNVDKANATAVDTMAMSKVELDEMLFIVEKLREDSDDSRGSGQ